MNFRKASDIISRMVDITLTGTQQINDFSDGSIILTLYEAVATQIESLYVLTQQNIQDGIEESIYEAFNFNRLPEQKAYGPLFITFNSALQGDFTLPIGTQVGSSNAAYTQVYETLSNYVIPSGSTQASVDVYCTQAGTIGNIPAGILDTMRSSLSNVQSVTNQEAFQTGQDEETLASVKSRFKTFIDSLARATVNAVKYGALSVPNIAGAYVDEKVGNIKVYCHDLNGDLSTDLQNQVTSTLVDYRPAGIPLSVLPIVKRVLSVSVTVTVNDKTQITTNYQSYFVTALTNYLNTKTVSQDLILSDIIQLLKNLDPLNVYDVTITAITDATSGSLPIANVLVANDELIRGGTVSVTLQ